jgi:hypothetical protein
MSRIILDHLRRWWWVWLLIGIAYGLMAGETFDSHRKIRPFQSILFPLILWAGAMELNFDLQRGIGRTIAVLPVTIRQIGRAWWIVSVALPAILLATTAGIGLMVYSSISNQGFPLAAFLATASANTLMLGALFALFVGRTQGAPQNAAEWLRHLLSVAFVIAMLFVPPSLSTPEGIFILLASLILTVVGWLRCEQVVVQRATFRPGIQQGKRTPGQHRAPSGFGGLPFLVQTQVIQFARFFLIFAAIMALMPLIQGRTLKLSIPELLHASLPALTSFGGFFTFMIMMMPVLLQLRYLRTLPICASALAAMLVLIPVAPVLVVGTVFNLATGIYPSPENFLPFPIQCLTYAAAMAIAVPPIVRHGMRSGSFVVLTLAMLATTLGPALFPSLKIPLLATTLVSLGIITLAFVITRRLLQSSSHAYRPPPANLASWGNWSGGR